MFSVKTLKEAGFEVSKKRRYSLPVIELTYRHNNGFNYTKAFILDNGKLFTAESFVDEADKLGYKKCDEVENIEELSLIFKKDFNLK